MKTRPRQNSIAVGPRNCKIGADQSHFSDKKKKTPTNGGRNRERLPALVRRESRLEEKIAVVNAASTGVKQRPQGGMSRNIL